MRKTSKPSASELFAARLIDSTDSARAAKLRYVYDTEPGITRHRSGKGFRYTGPDGKAIRDPATLSRIKALVVPPAWTDVWICANANGHLQVTGRDVRGRKQSRYHLRWRETRDEAKYAHMLAFARALPAIRKQVTQDMAQPGLPREKVLAAIVRIMETTFIRVGNETYARENKSFGLTTLRRRHVTIRGAKVIFNFRGKSGVQHEIDLEDRRLARIVKACHDTPGYELFEYLDDEGKVHGVHSTDVNEYLDRLTPPGSHFTAKDFRTWAGTVLACALLNECHTCSDDAGAATEAQLKKDVVTAIKSVAARLGNTPSVCRKCYVHPVVLERYLSGSFKAAAGGLSSAGRKSGLRPEEAAVLELLQTAIGKG